MFQGYTIGNVLSALFYQAALDANPSILDETSQGEFVNLKNWMSDNIYQYGKKYLADELVERITGGPMDVGPYLEYLRTKFGDLYNLD
jgi:carboxypeptidase Taq